MVVSIALQLPDATVTGTEDKVVPVAASPRLRGSSPLCLCRSWWSSSVSAVRIAIAQLKQSSKRLFHQVQNKVQNIPEIRQSPSSTVHTPHPHTLRVHNPRTMPVPLHSQFVAGCRVARALPLLGMVGKRPRSLKLRNPNYTLLLFQGRNFGVAAPSATSWLPDSMRQQLEQMKR